MDNIPLALSYDDVLLTPEYSQISSRSEIDLSTHLTKNLVLKIPIIAANMDTVTSIDMAIALGKLGGMAILPRFNTPDTQANNVALVKKTGVLVGAAVGIREDPLGRSKKLIHAGADLLVIDVAHGHMQQVIDITIEIKNTFPNIPLVSGNVATYDGAKALFEAGADCVKVGIGPGSVCTTRIQTGHGVPQITAVLEAARAAKLFRKTLICDGGIKNSGDIVKGLAAGSHAVMLGNLLAGTDESPGEIVKKDSKTFKQYAGSASFSQKSQQLKNINSANSNYLDQIEGVSALVPYKGSVVKLINNLLAGIRSGFSYSGAKNILELHQNARFVQITSQGVLESQAHDVLLN